MASNIYVGKRLSFDGQLCTIRYHGEVKGTKGDWLGVEWDDPTRGKHSGQHGDIRYFKCLSNHPTAGSFIRPTRKPDALRSFVEALKAKYASEDFEDPDVQIVFVTQEGDNKKKKDPLAKLNQPIRISGKEVEEVGFDKIRKQLAQLSELKIVILDGLCMSRPETRLKERGGDREMWAEGSTDVKDACPKAVELDLSRNLFEEWREVASICEQLERLRSLRADGNRFRDTALTDTERTHCLKVFANIKKLQLEENLLSWQDLAEITHQFSSLTSLIASSNLYSSLTPHALNPTITSLSLEDNLFPSISALLPLTNLPNLQRLILKSNRISETHIPDSSIPVFSSTITEVDLSFNEITTWSFIDALADIFPGLNSLRVSHNPLYTSLQDPNGRTLTPEDGYMLTLARLGNLKMLNYSPITDKERLNAESYYLSLIAREVQYAAENQAEQILASHPRYKWLCDEYGEPLIQRSANAVNPNSLAARLVRIKLYQKPLPSAEEDVDIASTTWEIEVPMSCTAYTLLGIVGKKLGIQPMKCRLIWETGDWVPARRAVEDIRSLDWESDSEGEEDGGKRGEGRVMREVEILPGTRSVGTWIEGIEAIVRVESK